MYIFIVLVCLVSGCLIFMDIICMVASRLLYEYCVLSMYTCNYRDFDDLFVGVERIYICYSAESCSD